jgi:WD40 repeat protein
VWSLAFAPDGRTLATGGRDNAVRLWDPDSGAEVRKFEQPAADAKGLRNMRALAFAPDGQTLAACGPRGRVGTETWGWNPRTGEERFRLETGWSECIAFSPDGRLLAASAGTSTGEKVVRLWDVAARRVRATLAGHQDVVYFLAFSPDGKTLATGSWDGTVRLWHVASAQPLVTLRGHRGAVYCVVFSPDGRTLASSSAYRQAPNDLQAADVLIWHAATADEVAAQLAAATAAPGTVLPHGLPAEPRLPVP